MVVQLCSAVHPQALLPKQNVGLGEVREHRRVVLLVLMNTLDSSQ